MTVERVTIEELRRRHAAGFTKLLANDRSSRGRQRPRDREETRLLVELARAAWARAEAEGRLRRLPGGGLAFGPARRASG